MDVADPIEENEELEKLGDWLLAENLTCKQILDLMAQVDDGRISAEPEEMKQLSDRLKDKADAYHAVREEKLARIFLLDNRIAPWARERAREARDVANLDKLLLWNMENNGLETLPGNEYKVEIKKGRGSLEPIEQPTPADMIKHRALIKTSYEWKKNEVKKVLTARAKLVEKAKKDKVELAKDPEFEAFAKRFQIVISKKIEFKPNVEGLKK